MPFSTNLLAQLLGLRTPEELGLLIPEEEALEPAFVPPERAAHKAALAAAIKPDLLTRAQIDKQIAVKVQRLLTQRSLEAKKTHPLYPAKSSDQHFQIASGTLPTSFSGPGDAAELARHARALRKQSSLAINPQNELANPMTWGEMIAANKAALMGFGQPIALSGGSAYVPTEENLQKQATREAARQTERKAKAATKGIDEGARRMLVTARAQKVKPEFAIARKKMAEGAQLSEMDRTILGLGPDPKQNILALIAAAVAKGDNPNAAAILDRILPEFGISVPPVAPTPGNKPTPAPGLTPQQMDEAITNAMADYPLNAPVSAEEWVRRKTGGAIPGSYVAQFLIKRAQARVPRGPLPPAHNSGIWLAPGR